MKRQVDIDALGGRKPTGTLNNEVTELKSINGLQGSTIQIGQVLELPGNESPFASEHKIQRGETLSEIAQFYRVSLADLREANNLRGDRILIGQTLIIPPTR